MFLCYWQARILTTFAHAQTNRRASHVSDFGALVVNTLIRMIKDRSRNDVFFTMSSCWWMTRWYWPRAETVLYQNWEFCVNFAGRMEWLSMIKRPNLWLSMAQTRTVLRCRWRDWLLITVMYMCIYSISQEICTRFCCALLCCGYAIVHNEFTWSIYPYSSGLLCWHWGNR